MNAEHRTEIRELLERVRRRWRTLMALRAFVRGALLAAVVVGAALLATRWTGAAPLALLPDRVGLDATPGNARVKAGSALAIEARLVGNRAPIIAQVQIADGDRWRVVEMTSQTPGSFRLALPSIGAPFKYRVVA